MKKISWTGLIIFFQIFLIAQTFKNFGNFFKIHHFTVVTNYMKKTSTDLDSFYKKIVNDNPIKNIDSIKKEQQNDINGTSETPIFQNPRDTTVYIILQGKNSSVRVNDTLNKLTKKSPISMRPKCLVIYSQTKNLLDVETKKILHEAWSLKFLDFTIIRVNIHGVPIDYINYNPFKNIFNFGYWKNKYDLFPDKLIDVNKYPLNLPVYQLPPYMVIKSQNGNVISVHGHTPLIYLTAIAKKLNFKLNFTYYQDESPVKEYYKLIFSVANGQSHMTAIKFYFSDHIFDLKVLLGYPYDIGKWVMVAPIFLEYNIDIPLETFLYVVSFILILLIFVTTLKVLKMNSKQWNMLNLFGVLIGMGVSQPIKNTDRIIFLTLAIVSIVYSGDFFSTFTDIKVSGTEKEFNTYEDINKLQIPVYTTGNKSVFGTEFQKKVLYHDLMFNHSDCLAKVIYTRNGICVLNLQTAIFAVTNNLNAQGKQVMKIPDISIDPEFIGFFYEKGSPFAEKIEKLMLRMIQFSISPIRKIYNLRLHYTEDESSDNDETIIKTALSILIVGSFIATVTFAYELYNFFKTKENFKRNIRKIKQAFRSTEKSNKAKKN